MNTITAWLTNILPDAAVLTSFVVTVRIAYDFFLYPRDYFELVGTIPRFVLHTTLRVTRVTFPAGVFLAAMWFLVFSHGQPSWDAPGSWCYTCNELADGICETIENTLTAILTAASLAAAGAAVTATRRSLRRHAH